MVVLTRLGSSWKIPISRVDEMYRDVDTIPVDSDVLVGNIEEVEGNWEGAIVGIVGEEDSGKVCEESAYVISNLTVFVNYTKLTLRRLGSDHLFYANQFGEDGVYKLYTEDDEQVGFRQLFQVDPEYLLEQDWVDSGEMLSENL